MIDAIFQNSLTSKIKLKQRVVNKIDQRTIRIGCPICSVNHAQNEGAKMRPLVQIAINSPISVDLKPNSCKYNVQYGANTPNVAK